MDLNLLNQMNVKDFTLALEAIYESSPWVPTAAWQGIAFRDLGALHQEMVSAVKNAPLASQLALLCAHPELAGKEAEVGTLTLSSTKEQSSVGLNQLTSTEMVRIKTLNRAYRTKFGHPFIIAVRNHSKAGIFSALERRLLNSAETEHQQALEEVYEIARWRLSLLFNQPIANGD